MFSETEMAMQSHTLWIKNHFYFSLPENVIQRTEATGNSRLFKNFTETREGKPSQIFLFSIIIKG